MIPGMWSEIRPTLPDLWDRGPSQRRSAMQKFPFYRSARAWKSPNTKSTSGSAIWSGSWTVRLKITKAKSRKSMTKKAKLRSWCRSLAGKRRLSSTFYKLRKFKFYVILRPFVYNCLSDPSGFPDCPAVSDRRGFPPGPDHRHQAAGPELGHPLY